MSKSSTVKQYPGLLSALLTVAAGLSAAPVFATTVDLGTTPPDISSAVNPNVVVTFDDSGSMGATALPDAMADDYNNKYYYDPRQNLIYFDPLKDYPPPMKPDGSEFPNSVYTNAWRDGICANLAGSYCAGSVNTKNLSSRFYESFGNEAATSNRPNTLAGDNRAIPNTVRPTSGEGFWYNCPTAASNTGCTLYPVSTTADPKPALPSPAVNPSLQQRFANWYSYYRTRNLMTRTALSRVFAGPTLDNKVRVIWQTINADYSGTPAIRARNVQEMTGAWKTSFFNWMYEVSNNGSTPNRRATIEAGKVFERALTTNNLNPYYYPAVIAGGTARNLECRQNFHMLVTDGYWNEDDPTLPSPFTKVSDSVDLPGNTDYVPNQALTKVYSNVAAYNSSLGNIAFHYWARDLQPTLANKVPPYFRDRSAPAGTVVPPNDPGSVPQIFWNPANDPANWQHVVQYMVALGIAGELNFPGDYPALLAGTKAWPTPANNNPKAIDDTWHAAVNSRGEYFSAKNPGELVEQLTAILTGILTRRGGSTTPSVSTGVLTTGTLGFVAGYDSADWSGFLLGQDLDNDGNLVTPPIWDAGCKLTGGECASLGSTNVTQNPTPGARVILTSEGTSGTGRPFRWTSLSTAQRTALNSADSRGEERVNYLRGERASETLTNAFRRRGSLLGPIVNAQPRYYGPVEANYVDDWPVGAPEEGSDFAAYADGKLSRPERVFMAANDGMLHVFDANDDPALGGVEKWAFVPNTLIGNGKLKALTDPGVGLVPSVDDRPVITEAFIRGEWRSILVGSLRFGGRGIYALDVSTDMTEANASSRVLWEFNANSTGGANLGYTYDSANVARLRNGKWVVLVSSGYFPKVGPDSTITPAVTDTTSLFVIDLETGTLIREIKTPASVRSYGLSGPEVVSYSTGQEVNIDDYAFAGDLAGNLWRFDLTSATPASWSVELMFQTYDGAAADIGKQAITSTPIAFNDRRGSGSKGGIILFGTGRYLGDEDRLATGTPTQSLYGIRDYGPGSGRVQKSTLIAQTLVDDGTGKRSLSNNAVSLTNKGWRMDLPALGERNVVTLTPIFVNGLAVFSTVIPSGDNPCDPSRTGAIIVVDAMDGSGPGDLLNEAFGVPPNGRNWAGIMVQNPPAAGVLGAVTLQGGGSLVLPGIPPLGGAGAVKLDVIPIWRRGSWRESLDYTD
jgi:type IV pilus assembly protein PilY1